MELPEPQNLTTLGWTTTNRSGRAEMKLSRTLTSSYASSKRRQQEWMDKSASRDSQRNVEQACVVKKSEPDSQGASPNRFIIMFKNNRSSEKTKNLNLMKIARACLVETSMGAHLRRLELTKFWQELARHDAASKTIVIDYNNKNLVMHKLAL